MNRFEQAEILMRAFAERTGLVGRAVPRRYLWTDAFAVCNYLSLFQVRSDEAFLALAERLVAQVHDVLGAYAENDTRSGWLGGLTASEHSRSPTRAGLRIGKRLPERGPHELFDERSEWDRDGQYFHYLTRWMHALLRMAEVTGEARYHRWAVELALAAFNGFVHRGRDGRARMYWKVSVDLDRPLVQSMGHHDSLDGWVIAMMLSASDLADEDQRCELQAPIVLYRNMQTGQDLATGDALGIGGLLVDAWQLFRIAPEVDQYGHDRIADLVDAASAGLVEIKREFHAVPANRLGFRELGLGIGLRAAQRLSAHAIAAGPLRESLQRIAGKFQLADLIEQTWLRTENRTSSTWTDHRDINEAMLATCLAPEGYLGPAPG